MLGNNIKKAREKLNISQRELGRIINKTGQYISYLESKAESNPSLDVLEGIAKALGIPISRLTTISIEEKINNLMEEQNISIDDMVKKTGLDPQGLPINEGEHTTYYGKETLRKVSNVLNIDFYDLIKDTTCENFYSFSPEEDEIIKRMADYANKQIELNNMNVSQRRELDHIGVEAMAELLDIPRTELETFEKEPYRHPILKKKYIDALSEIEAFQLTLLTTMLNSHNIDLKKLFSLTALQSNTLINLIVSNINNLIPEVQRLSMINLDPK